jgi:CHAT domain-containing protein
MTEFYERRQANPLRLFALRAAQLSLLSGDTRIENNRLITQAGQSAIPNGLISQDTISFKHPFFWAGFMLVGNPWW